MFLPVNITLQFGDTGDFVAELQRRLSLINLFNEAFINATFDSNTVNAVKSFQSMQGLRVDGVAGPETLRRLNGVVSGDSSTSSGDKKEEEQQAQSAALGKDMLLADMFGTVAAAPVDPTLSAAPAAEEKPVEQKPAVAAPPPRADMQAPSPDVAKNNLINDLVMQSAPPPQQQSNPQLEQQQQQQMEALKQQEAAKQAAAKPPEPKPEQKPVEKKEEAQPEKKPLSAMLQKLVDYIESKLPRAVVDEVKSIGQTMMKAGVREAAMPAGDSPAAPAVEAGRGQQQQAQRG